MRITLVSNCGLVLEQDGSALLLDALMALILANWIYQPISGIVRIVRAYPHAIPDDHQKSELDEIRDHYGADLYKEALTMLARGWEGDPDSLRSGILRGMVRFVALYQGEYDPERLVKRLQTIHPMTLVRDEKSLSGTVSYKYMMLILRTYNGSSRRFNLPIKQ